jgi:hypothetical protein
MLTVKVSKKKVHCNCKKFIVIQLKGNSHNTTVFEYITSKKINNINIKLKNNNPQLIIEEPLLPINLPKVINVKKT